MKITPPKWTPSATDASFPLGSIIPYINSVTVKVSPSSRLAVVPVILLTGRRILMFVVSYAYGEPASPYLSTKFSTHSEVIILVREATYRDSASHFPNIRSPFFLSIIAQLAALTYGAGFSSSSFC